LAVLRERFDYLFIDCPPSLGLLALNALVAADTVLIPIQCEYYALEGLSQLMATMRQVKRLYNENLEIEGVLLTMYDGRTNLSIQVGEEVKRYFKRKVFFTLIPRNVRLSEAPSHGKPVLAYDRWSRGTEAYIALAKELIKNNS
jgi:chromosome partitioning protein